MRPAATIIEAYYREGLNLVAEGEVAQAAQFLRRAVDLKPYNPYAAAKLAEIYTTAYLSNPKRVAALVSEITDLKGKYPSDQIKQHVARRIGSEARVAIPALTLALKDEYDKVRRSAAGALGTFGPEAKATVPALTEALMQKDMQPRHFAARALVRIGNQKAKQAAAQVLREVLRQGAPDQRVRVEIIVFLWRIGPEPASTLPATTSVSEPCPEPSSTRVTLRFCSLK